ncbi:MAG TPA: amino acid ABC transporter permease [Firmicutes bacterium]|nr:amino acid ABC transporter permease [Bacillota bacterium]
MRKKRWFSASQLVQIIAAGIILLGFMLLSLYRIGYEMNFASLWQFRHRLWQGFVMTLVIAVASLCLSVLIGAVAALAQKAKIAVVSYLAKIYIQIIRGTPLLVQIYFFFYIIATSWGIDNRYLAGILILSLFEGAYIAEIIRGGLESIDSQQYEIARAIGLTSAQTIRLVTFPLLMARILPALAGQFASIIKDSSLLSVIAVIEITQTTQEISAQNFMFFENYFFLGLQYFVLTFTVSLITRRLERKYKHADNA